LVTQKLGQARSGAQFPGQGVLPARPIERLPKVFLGRCHRPVTILQQQLTFDAAYQNAWLFQFHNASLTTANASPIRQADDKTPAKWVRNMAW
jgi:hypothetical protein